MPIYEYRCHQCGQLTDALQKMSDPPLQTDPQTGEPVRRIITGGSGLVTHGASILSMKTRGR